MAYCLLCYLQKVKGEAEVSCIDRQLHLKRNAIAALRKENMECEQNVEDYKIKISQRYSVKAKTVEKDVTSSIGYNYLLL